MKSISFRNSARQRNPIPSLGSSDRVKAMRRVGITQLSGTNPLWWIDYSQTQVADGTPIEPTLVPQRKAVSWAVSGPAARAAWTSQGLEFAGAQVYSRGTGTDVSGQLQVSIISVIIPQPNGGPVVEATNSRFYNQRGLTHNIGIAAQLIMSEGPLPTNYRNFANAFGERVAFGSYWDTANPDPNLTELGSKNGETPTVIASQVDPKGTPFAMGNLFFGARPADNAYYEGTIKAVLLYNGENSQNNLNELTRVAQWSVR